MSVRRSLPPLPACHSFIRPASPSHREPGERSLFTERQADALWTAAFGGLTISLLALRTPDAPGWSLLAGCVAAVTFLWFAGQLIVDVITPRSLPIPQRFIVPPSVSRPPRGMGERSPFDWSTDLADPIALRDDASAWAAAVWPSSRSA